MFRLSNSQIEDTLRNAIGTAGPPGGGCGPVSPRIPTQSRTAHIPIEFGA